MNRNPLESLGIPKYIVVGIWGDASLTEVQRVARLMDVIKNAYRGLQRSLHTDVAGENRYIREITEAFEDIEPEILPAIISRYITTDDIQRERDMQAVSDRIGRAEKRASALLSFLHVADWRELLGGELPVELLFGLPENLWDNQDSYLNTFLLACKPSGQVLSRLAHPEDGDLLVPTTARFSEVPEWRDGEWRVDDFDYSQEERVKPRTFRFGEPRPIGPVRLVGQVRPEVMYALAGSQGSRVAPLPGAAMPVLTGGAPASTLSERVVWWEPFGAWWLTGLEPKLQLGNYVVVARGEGPQLRLAILGRYLTARPLA